MDLRISVVIPVYNAERYVEAAITSALQFKEVKEVIVVDDAGPDNSLAVCRAVAAREPRVKVLQHEGAVNKGAAASRNLGMRHATCPWIAFLDADDKFLPNRFSAERQVIQDHPDADGVYGAIAPYYHDDAGKDRFARTFGSEVTTVKRRVLPEELFDGLTGGIPDFGHLHLNALTVRKDAVLKFKVWMRPEINLHEDTDFFIRLAWYARLYPGSIETPVALRGVHESNRITASSKYSVLRSILYQLLWDWAVSAGCGERATSMFHYKWKLHAVGSAKTRMAACRLAVGNKGYMAHYDFRDALFNRIAGPAAWRVKLLHKVGWRIWHQGQPAAKKTLSTDQGGA